MTRVKLLHKQDLIGQIQSKARAWKRFSQSIDENNRNLEINRELHTERVHTFTSPYAVSAHLGNEK